MILNGANAIGNVANEKLGISGNLLWCFLLGALNIIWIVAGIKNVSKINNIAVGALFILTALLGITVFQNQQVSISSEIMSFGLALELSIAMPISWLPLISDYTKNTDKPARFTLVSTTSYFIGSSFMYVIGLGAAIYAGNSDVVQILMKAGFGFAAMVIVILSTVTTTYLDVFSAAESMHNIRKKWNAKWIGVAVCMIGTMIAVFTPIEQYENFLYLIGSVFVPMAAILITDYFILLNKVGNKYRSIVNSILWVVGFLIYRVFLGMDLLLGSTIPVVIVVMTLCIITNIMKKVVYKNV
jgi:putative hydroxymethylpyrimidine transporter CytX